MQALELIDKAQSGAAMANLARTLGITEAEARSATEAALPELAAAIERNTLSRSGLADLVTALGQGHHEQVLSMPTAWTDPRVLADGQAILTHVMGSEQKTEALAARTARASGLGSSIIGILLPILAQWLMGALAKGSKGGLGDILSRLPIPGGGSSDPNPRPGSRRRGDFDTGGTMGDNTGFELPKSEMPSGGYPMPPIPGSDGSDGRSEGSRSPWPGGTSEAPITRERPRSGTGFDLPTSETPAGGYPMPPLPPAPEGDDYGSDTRPRREGGSQFPFPLPGPSSDNPYGDLSDILRRGGRLPSGEQAGGRGLGSVVRDTIGSALGFGKKGLLGWIIQLVLLRWGWSFLRRILLGR